MIVTILGSGTCVPSLARSSCAVLVEVAGAKVLLDCGAGTMRRLLEANVTIFDVSHLFLSHFHPDHSGELASFLFANKYAWPPPFRHKPLVLAGGTGLMRFYENLKTVYGEWIQWGQAPQTVALADLLTIREFSDKKPETADYEGFLLETRPVSHRPESVAYKITSKGMSVVYSGDTDVDDNLVALASGADLLICESALPDGLKVEGHLTPSLAGRLAAEAKVKRLVLTHLYPPCDKVDIKAQCQSVYSGEIVVAEDLLRLEL